MASVFTIQGPELEGPEVCRRKKDGKEYQLDECITVKNARTRCTYEICCVGKKRKSRTGKTSITGWWVKAGSKHCPNKG